MLAVGELSDVQLGQRCPSMDVSTALHCLSSHLVEREPRWFLLPTLGLVLGEMAHWEAPSSGFSRKYFGSLFTLKLLHMMKL
jgi:hypothetical protein